MSLRDDIRNKIASAADIKHQIVHSNAWDCDVEVRGMSGTARAAIMAVGYDESNKVNYLTFYPALIIATAYVPGTTDESGKYTPTDIALFEVGDADLLNSKSAAALEEIALPAMKLSGLSKDDLANAEKNSATSPNSASGST